MAATHQAGLPYAWPKRKGAAGMALWNALATSLLIAIALVLAITVSSAFMFVSLGSIAYEIIDRPLARAASPRNVIVANAIALCVGYAMLAMFGLTRHPSVTEEGVSVVRGGAVVAGIASLSILLIGLKASSPPAGSTVMLVTLGVEHRPLHLVYVFAAIVAITVIAWLLNRFAGIPVPVWSSPEPAPSEVLTHAEPG